MDDNYSDLIERILPVNNSCLQQLVDRHEPIEKIFKYAYSTGNLKLIWKMILDPLLITYLKTVCEDEFYKVVGFVIARSTYDLEGFFDDILNLIHKTGFNINSDLYGSDGTLLHEVSARDRFDLVEQLLEMGADPFIENKCGFLPVTLMTAEVLVKYKDEYIDHLRYVVSNRPEIINQVSISGHTLPMKMYDDGYGFEDILPDLVDMGFDLTRAANNNRTLLHYAVYHDDVECVKKLIEMNLFEPSVGLLYELVNLDNECSRLIKAEINKLYGLS